MDIKVVDASALGAILFKEPEREAIARRLEGARLIAPVLLGFEIANVCLTKLRRHPDQHAGILQAFLLQGGLTIEPAEVDYPGVLFLAEETALTSYDASYLWLARQLGAELVTIDRDLARAATRLAPGC